MVRLHPTSLVVTNHKLMHKNQHEESKSDKARNVVGLEDQLKNIELCRVLQWNF